MLSKPSSARPIGTVSRRFMLCAITLSLAACNAAVDQPEPVASSAPDTGEIVGTDIGADNAPIPVCRNGDTRTRIPVWRPSIDDDGVLSSAPPQHDGLVVYIDMYTTDERTVSTCGDGELKSFAWPDDPGSRAAGGLAVNIQDNGHRTNGACNFYGYYMNEEVQGMHQGWSETYFGVMDKKELVLSGTFCLDEAIR